MPTFVINGLAGAAGGLARSLLGWARSRTKFRIKWVVGSIVAGFIAGAVLPDPMTAAIAGYAGSDAAVKVWGIPPRRKLPRN